MSPSRNFAIFFLAFFVITEVKSTNPFSYATVQQCIDIGQYYNVAELKCSPCGDCPGQELEPCQEPTADGKKFVD